MQKEARICPSTALVVGLCDLPRFFFLLGKVHQVLGFRVEGLGLRVEGLGLCFGLLWVAYLSSIPSVLVNRFTVVTSEGICRHEHINNLWSNSLYHRP
jgi:hypothetical protein